MIISNASDQGEPILLEETLRNPLSCSDDNLCEAE